MHYMSEVLSVMRLILPLYGADQNDSSSPSSNFEA